jgi:hypothetical protein
MGELSNPEDHVITVRELTAKRADILFDIGQAEREAERLRIDLGASGRRVGLALNVLQRKGKIERLGKGSVLRWKLVSEA